MDKEQIANQLKLEYALYKRIDAVRMLVLDQYADKIFTLFDTIKKCRGTIYICGNGGSALTAQHWALHLSELGKDVRCLVDNVGLLTAIANDYDYEGIFWCQLRKRITEDDLLIMISGSGLSSNIKALTSSAGYKVGIFARVMPKRIDPSKVFSLRERCDLLIDLPTTEYGTAEDMHLMLIHLLVELNG